MLLPVAAMLLAARAAAAAAPLHAIDAAAVACRSGKRAALQQQGVSGITVVSSCAGSDGSESQHPSTDQLGVDCGH